MPETEFAPRGSNGKIGSSNRVTHSQFFRLCTILSTEKEKILATKPTYYSLCAELSARIGCNITRPTLTKAMNEVGLKYRPSLVGTHDGGMHCKSLLRNSLIELTQIVTSVADTVEQLHVSLAGEVPAKLTTAQAKLTRLDQTLRGQR